MIDPLPEENEPSKPMVRILLAELPTFLAALLREIISMELDMSVVGEVQAWDDLEAVFGEGHFDVIVTSVTESRLADLYQRVIFRSEQIALITITSDGHDLHCYSRKTLQDISMNRFIEVLREAVGAGR